MSGILQSGLTNQVTLGSGDFAVPAADTADNIDWGDVIGNKTDTIAGDSIVSLIRGIGTSQHSPLYTGIVRYVDGTNGNDANSGLTPTDALATIGAAIAASVAGDAITVRAGTYDENGLDVNLDGLEIWGEIGTIIVDTTPGTCLTVSGDYCYLRNIYTAQAAQIGFLVTGSGCWLERCRAQNGPSVGFDINGTSGTYIDCYVGQPTTTGFDIGANGNKFVSCHVTDSGGAIRGYYITNSADRCLLVDCTSIGCGTAGYEVTAGCLNTMLADCVSSGSDGPKIDAGTGTMWADFIDQMTTEHHEHLYPASDGQGTAGDPVTVNNSTTDDVGGARQDQNYWGDVVVLLAPDTLELWRSIGIYIHASTAADIQQWQILYTFGDTYVASQNGGNDWDHNETALTIDDASPFLDGDLVWVTGNDRPAGEIQKIDSIAGNVITIVSETRASGGLGLRYDYDTDPSANKIYLVQRTGIPAFHGTRGDYSASGARDWARISFHTPREIPANGGMLIRMLNATDAGASTFDVSMIYED